MLNLRVYINRAVTRMDTPKQGWTPYDIYTTEILLKTVKEV